MMVLRTWLLGFSALGLAMVAAGGAEAKTPCRDAKGHSIPCPQAKAPAPEPDSSGGACVWLIAHGILAPCTLI
jgi:hypothetical protein